MPPDHNPGMAIRILVVARWYPSNDVPGRGSFVADQVAALRDAGAHVAVICPDPVYAEGLDGAGRQERLARIEAWAAVIGTRLQFARPSDRGAADVPVLRIPAPIPAGGSAARDPLTLSTLETATLLPVGTALHAIWPFDVIHAHTGLPDGLAAAALADSVGVPLLTTEHDSATPDRLTDPGMAAAYRSLIAPRRAVVAVSAALAGRISAQLGLASGEIGVVPNVLPIDTFDWDPARARDPDELLWVGARKESKGIATLLRAFAIIHAERPSLRLRLIGRPATVAEEHRLVTLAEDLRISAVVRFEPPTNRAGVAAAMARAGLFVHPSPWETFGMVAAEALAMGLPVAATPSGGVEEILGSDGRFGTIARDHEPASLAGAIGDALDRRAALEPASLRAHVAERLAPGVIAGALLARFADLGALEGPDLPELPGPGSLAVPVVVVGFRRASALGRIPLLPKDLRAELVVVTSAPVHPVSGQSSGEPTSETDVARWMDVDPGAAFRSRLSDLGSTSAKPGGRWRSIRHPVRALQRRRLWAAQPESFAAARRQAVDEAITYAMGAALARGSGAPSPVMVVPIDADDLEPIQSAVADGRAVLAPGTLGWLADRWATHEP